MTSLPFHYWKCGRKMVRLEENTYLNTPRYFCPYCEKHISVNTTKNGVPVARATE